MMSRSESARTSARRVRWPRVVAIAAAAIILASCRSIEAPVLLSMAAQVGASRHASEASADGQSVGPQPDLPAATAPAVVATTAAEGPGPRSGSDLWPAAVRLAGRARASTPVAVDAVVARATVAAATRSADEPDTAVVLAGCETCPPPLPRHGRRSCRPAAACRECPGGDCGPEVCTTACRAVPVVGPYLVCDGGDGLAPARPVGRSGIVNLTAGDTVARYRADDGPRRFRPRAAVGADDDHVAEEAGASGRDDDPAAEACLAVSNCACVFSPRFASVREVTRPLEEAAPVGPGGLAADTVAEADVGRQPVWGSVQPVAPESARKALPGVAIEERLPPLAVDQGEAPREADAAELPAARVADQQPELMLRTQRPLLKVGFEVPLAWTCVTAANVLLNNEAADVIASDRGTATLRFEEPGRCELTLCKRAGSDTARIGEELDFTIYLLNSGDRPLTDIVLVDTLPRRLELVPDSAAASLSADFSTEAGDDGSVVLRWQFAGTLRPNEAGFVRFRTIVR